MSQARWEYLVTQNDKPFEEQKFLSALGDDRWELITVNFHGEKRHTYYLKRVVLASE